MKGRDLIALTVDKILPARGNSAIRHGERALLVAGQFDLAAALSDDVRREPFEAFTTALRTHGFRAVSEATPTHDCRALFQIVAALAPGSVLEIGTHVGASTLFIAAGLREAGRGSLTTVDVLDVNAPAGPWSGIGLPAPPRLMLRRLGLEDIVTFRHQSSRRYFATSRKLFDLIWIDGSHSEVPAFFDIRSALGSLAPGGLILLHDFYADGAGNPGVRKAAERLRRSAPWFDARALGQFPFAPDFRTSIAACQRLVQPQLDGVGA